MELEIVCTAYERPVLLMTQLCSLAAQTKQNFNVIVYHDGYNPLIEAVVSDFRKLFPNIQTEFKFSDHRYNDYGHSLREIALMEATSKYLLLTNDDNYYTPNFIEELMPALESGNFDISYCNMIHSHMTYRSPSPIGYQPLYTQTQLGWIDIGSFIFNTKLGQAAGFSDRGFDADGLFLERMMRNGARAFKIEKFLFVHN